MTRTFNIVFHNYGAQDETQFDLEDGDFAFMAMQLLDLWTEFIRENHPERMDDPGQMQILDVYEVKPLTSLTAAERIFNGLIGLVDSYRDEGDTTLASGVFTIAMGLKAAIIEGAFGTE